MRKGRQFTIFGIPPTPGLSNYLSGIDSNGEDSSTNILTYVHETEVENLYVIPAGNIPPNPSELLVTEQMQTAMEELGRIYDLIIFDGTPSVLVTDAIILARYVDTTIIVTSYKETKLDALEKIKRDIENVGGKIAGVVINKTNVSQKEYYDSYYYAHSSGKKHKRKTRRDRNAELENKRVQRKEKAREILKQNWEEKTVNNTDKTEISEENNYEENDYRTTSVESNVNVGINTMSEYTDEQQEN